MKIGEILKEEDLQKELDRVDLDTYVGWRIKIQFRDTIEGGIPMDPEMIRSWLLAKKAKGELKMEDAEIEALIRSTAQEVYEPPEVTEEEKEKESTERVVKASWNGFKSDEEGLYIEARQVKAMLKEVVNTLKLAVANRGLRQLLQHGCHVDPVRIHLGVKEPSGFRESIVHARYGSAFKRSDYVEKATVEFRVFYAQVGNLLTDKRFLNIMSVARENGIGSNRSEGKGKFDILEIEKIQEPKPKKEKKEKGEKKESK